MARKYPVGLKAVCKLISTGCVGVGKTERVVVIAV